MEALVDVFAAKLVERQLENFGGFIQTHSFSMHVTQTSEQMVLNLSPLAAHLQESLTSLRFATKVTFHVR
jgi:hypothetical protein